MTRFQCNFKSTACLREAILTRSDIKLTNKTKLSFHKILISRVRYISSTKSGRLHALRLEIECSYFRCKIRNKFRDFIEQVEITGRGKDSPHFKSCLLHCQVKLKSSSLHIPHADINEIILVRKFFSMYIIN